MVVRAQTPPLAYAVKKLSLDKAESVFRVANEKEKRALLPILIMKRANAVKKAAHPTGSAFSML